MSGTDICTQMQQCGNKMMRPEKLHLQFVHLCILHAYA